MKKFYVALSIFFGAVLPGSFEPIRTKGLATEEPLYWYPVNASTGTIDHTALINPTGKLTKSQLRVNGAIPCPEMPGMDCIRGFTTLQTADIDTEGVDFTQTQLQ